MERNIKTFVLFCLLIRVPLLCDILPEKRKLDRLISTRSTCSTSKSCPPQRNYELWHSHCKHSCLDDERYICLENEDGEPITEFCAPASLKCEPGTKGVFTIDNNDHTKVVMTVTPCPQDRYQQHSSNCINACKGNRGDFTGLPEEFVIYSNGSSVEPPRVYCNYTAGYYNPDNSFLFPYDDSFIHYYGPYCIHVNDSDPCSKGMMPLPNGSCVEPCIVGHVRDDHDNFICKPLSINPVNVDGKYLTTQLTTVFQSTTEGNKNQSWTSRYIFMIIGGIVVVVVIGLIIFLCCLWKRKQKNGNNYSDGNREGIEEEVQPLQDIEGETPADKSEEEIAFINEANGKIANGTGALPKKEGTTANGTGALPKEGTMVNGTDALPKEGTMVNGTDALPKEGTMVNGTDALPKEGTMVNGTDALPNKEGTMVNGTDALPKEGTMVNGTGALPNKEGTMVNGTDALPKEGTMPNGTDALPKEGTMVNGTDALPKEGTMVNGTDALPKEGKMVNGTDALPKEGTMVNGTDALPKEGKMVNGTDALPKEGTMPNGTDALPKEGTMVNGTDALPKEGKMVNGTDALPKEGTMVNGTDALPKEGKMVNGTDALPKEGTMVNGTGALPNKEGTMVNGTDALPKKEGTMPNGTNAIPKKEGTRANDKNRNIKDAEDQVPLQDTKVNSDINKNIKGAGEQVPLQDTEACAEVNSEKRALKRRNGKAGELKKTYNDTLTPTILTAVNSQAESVGCLICEEGIAGTVFKVGTNHAMTACHVVYFIIRIDKNGPNENGNFDWSQLTSDSVYVNFNELITDKPRKVSKVTCVYFNEHLDVAVLKFEDVLSIPRKMVLDKSIYRNPQKVTVIGFGNPDNNLKKHVDPSCEVIPPGSMKIRSAHAWLQGEGRLYRNNENADNFDYGYQGYGDQHKIIFSCYLEHGASGSPIITQDRAQNVQVVGILTNGMPDFYFELSKSDQEKFPCEYRFECGTLMRYIYEDMLVKNKILAEDIFGASGEAQHQVEGPIHIVPG